MKIGPVDSGEWRSKPRERQKPRVEPAEARQEPAPNKDSVKITNSSRLPSEPTRAAEPPPQPADDAQTSSPDEAEEASSDEAADDQAKEDEDETDQAKLDEAVQKGESGFYDRPEVREQIARRITDDLMG